MIGLDTNILVRYLTRDDEPQYRAVLKLLLKKTARFFVCDQVLVELDWVLSSLYDWSRDEIADAFVRLLSVHNLQFADESRIRAALKAVRNGADLADESIASHSREQGCHELATFDKNLVKRHPKYAFVPQE